MLLYWAETGEIEKRTKRIVKIEQERKEDRVFIIDAFISDEP